MIATPRLVAAGAVHLPGWLGLERQQWIVRQFRAWVDGPVPIRSARVRGHEMSVRTVCLGWHWQPYRYTREATDVNGRRVLDFPGWLVDLGRDALAAVGEPDPGYTPDTALVNEYDAEARMGMHQDKDQRSLAPVVSLSIGDTGIFRFGNPHSRGRPYTDLELHSGDLFVFGGESRLAYHGVPRILPGTAPAGCGLASARLNLTLRETGLTDAGGDPVSGDEAPLVVGEDGLARPVWASTDPLLREYYDTEWGMPVTDERGVFERLSLEAFQSGLSWLTILRKRPAFRAAFADFDAEVVAGLGEADVTRLMADAGIVRNLAKIRATITNAQATLDLRPDGGLADFVWGFRPATTPAPRSYAEVPTRSPESVALSKALRRHGFVFVGPTTMFALMEAIGMVDTHLVGSHRRGSSGVWPA